MQLSSIKRDVEALQSVVQSIDFDVISGADASCLVDVLVPLRNVVDACISAGAARAVAGNQHNVAGARSGAAWVGEKTGVTERQARSQLAVANALSELSDVDEAARKGSISFEKASAIARSADGDSEVASELLRAAETGSMECLGRKIQEIKASQPGTHERRRRSQYVHITTTESMVRAEMCLLPELATFLVEADRRANGASAWERAESFVECLSGLGSRESKVVFHVDLSSSRCELEGFGPVPRASVVDILEEASFGLVGTCKNKLVWFSESDRRSRSKEPPSYVRRAVLEAGWGRCAVRGCIDRAEHLDHVLARTNGGSNDLENLQPLCEADHHAKTKRDAPWTAGGIYGKYQPKPPVHLPRREPPQGKLFRDTG